MPSRPAWFRAPTRSIAGRASSPTDPPPKPERVIQINNSQLNPGTRDFAVSFRYRTTKKFGNIMQKGQATTKGGNFKFQLPKGNVTCLIRGASGQRAVRTVGAVQRQPVAHRALRADGDRHHGDRL